MLALDAGARIGTQNFDATALACVGALAGGVGDRVSKGVGAEFNLVLLRATDAIASVVTRAGAGGMRLDERTRTLIARFSGDALTHAACRVRKPGPPRVRRTPVARGHRRARREHLPAGRQATGTGRTRTESSTDAAAGRPRHRLPRGRARHHRQTLSPTLRDRCRAIQARLQVIRSAAQASVRPLTPSTAHFSKSGTSTSRSAGVRPLAQEGWLPLGHGNSWPRAAGRVVLTISLTDVRDPPADFTPSTAAMSPRCPTDELDGTSGVARLVYEGLIGNDIFTHDYQPRPGVAERWDISDDGLRYRFHLRPDAKWSNGEPVTAHDFVYSWRRALLPDTVSDYAAQFQLIKGGAAFYNWRQAEIDAIEAMPAGPERQAAASTLWKRTEQAFIEMVGLRALPSDDGRDGAILEVELERPTPYFLDLSAFAIFFRSTRRS